MATTTTTSPVHTGLTMPGAAPRRIAAAASVAVALGLFFTVAAIDVPHGAGDAELMRWWQEKSNRTDGIFSGLAAVGVALSFPIVTGYLFQLQRAARAPYWRSFARSMATAVTALWLVTGAVRAAIGRFVDVSDEQLFGPDSLRLATALNYSLLGLSGMAVLSLAILSISVLVLRARVLARWVGHVGLGCGLVMLASVVAQYGAFTTILGVLWAFCLAVAVWRGHDHPVVDAHAQ
jgi:hypothetical protein